MALLVLGAVLLPSILLAQVPKIANIPDNLPAQQHQMLAQTRESLTAQRNELIKKAADHNGKCSAVPKDTPEWKGCSEEQTELEAERQRYIDAVNRFNEEVANAISAQGSPSGSNPGVRIGSVAECRGTVFMITPGGRQFPVQIGTPIPANAHVVTGPDGHFKILLADETTFTLGPDSDMVLDEFVYDSNTSVGKITAELTKGALRWVTGKITHANPENMRVKLAAGVIGPRGTDFEASVKSDGSGYVKLFTGHVEITENKTGALLLLNPGEMVAFTADGTFRAPGPITPGSRQ